MSEHEFEKVVDYLNPVNEKKATFIGVLTSLIFLTWLLLIPAVVWAVYSWAF